MRVDRTRKLIDSGNNAFDSVHTDVVEAIDSVKWPPDADQFVVFPEEDENGVGPITDQFETALDETDGWESTGRKHFKTVLQERDRLDKTREGLSDYCDNPIKFVSSPWFDALGTVPNDGRSELAAVEWETGNISSSHRSLNRLTLGLAAGIITVGIVVLPTRSLYHYLTDRVGNYPELEPYFAIWESLAHEVETGVLAVVAVEHDDTAVGVPPIGKGTDGMATRPDPDSN